VLDTKARSLGKSWTKVAHEFGYYDQMHMVHDWRASWAEFQLRCSWKSKRFFEARLRQFEQVGLRLAIYS